MLSDSNPARSYLLYNTKARARKSLLLDTNKNVIEQSEPTATKRSGWRESDASERVSVIRRNFALILIAACFVCYYNSLWGDFVHDDIVAIKKNADVTGKSSWESLGKIFKNDFWGRPMSSNQSHKSYRPLTILTFRLNFLLGELSTFGYHGINVLLHTAVTLLFFRTCCTTVFDSAALSFQAALLFAVHPIHTEAVSGLVGRADVLACLIFLLAFLAYNRCISHGTEDEFPKTSSSSYLLLSIVLGALSMLAKEHGITVFGVCLLYDMAIVCRNGIKSFFQSFMVDVQCLSFVKRAAVMGIVVFLLLVFRVWIMNGTLPKFNYQDNPASFSPHISTRVMTYFYLLAFNGWLLLAPIVLCYDWQTGSIPLVESVGDFRNLTMLTFLLTMTSLAFCAIFSTKESERRIVTLGLGFLCLPFLPATNIFFRVGFVVAERILYISSMGYCILVAYGFAKMDKYLTPKKGSLKPILIFLYTLMVLLLGSRAIIRNRAWQSRQSLFRSGLETLPHNAKVHYNYANYLNDIGQSTEAMSHYEKALKLYPEHPSAHNNLGILLVSLGNTTQAESHFYEAIKNNPMHARAHFNLAKIWQKQEPASSKVEAMLRRAIQIDPEYVDPYISLAVILQDMGQMEQAERVYHKLLQLSPDDLTVYNNYGAFLTKLDHFNEALELYQKVLEKNPNSTVTIINLAKLLRSMSKTNEAEFLYIRALGIERDADTLQHLGALYFNTGRNQEALAMFNEALQLEPHRMETRTYYAQAISKEGRHGEALELLELVIKEQPDYAEAHRYLSNIYALMGKPKDALYHINKVLELGSESGAKAKADALFQRANHYRDLGDNQLALESYKQAVALQPSMAVAHMNLGAMYHLKGDYKSAREHYSWALSLDPDNRTLQENIQKLNRLEAKQQKFKSKENELKDQANNTN